MSLTYRLLFPPICLLLFLSLWPPASVGAETGPAPPPRTIHDVTAVLEDARDRNLEEFERIRAIADSQPPDTTETGSLLVFFYERARAAATIGRVRQSLTDYRQALALTAKSKRVPRDWLLLELGKAEKAGDNSSRGMELLQEGLRITKQLVRKAKYSAGLASSLAAGGELASAEKRLDEAEGYFNRKKHRLQEYMKKEIQAIIDGSRARVLEARGALAEAEAFHRRAVESMLAVQDAPMIGGRDPRSRRRYTSLLISRLASNLHRQGRLVESEVEARRALGEAIALYGRYSSHSMNVLDGLIRTIYDQGRYAEAETLARARLDTYARIGVAEE